MLEVGQFYSNNNGDYVVLSIQGDTMNIRYLDGQEQVLSLAIQQRIYNNRNLPPVTEQYRSGRTYQRQQGKGYQGYWTLGFLAQRIVHFGANIIAKKESQFRDEYQSITGKQLTEDQAGISFLREGANQWGNQGALAFRAKENELVLLKFRNAPYQTNQPETFEIKDINLFWFALEHGFQIGSQQNITAIQKTILPTDRDSFNNGYEYAQSQ